MDHVPETTGAAFPKQTLVQGRRAGTADLAREDTRAPGKGTVSQAQPKTPPGHGGTSLRCFCRNRGPEPGFLLDDHKDSGFLFLSRDEKHKARSPPGPQGAKVLLPNLSPGELWTCYCYNDLNVDRTGANSSCKGETRGTGIAGAARPVLPCPITSLMGQEPPSRLRAKPPPPSLCSSPTQPSQTQSLGSHLGPTPPVPLALTARCVAALLQATSLSPAWATRAQALPGGQQSSFWRLSAGKRAERKSVARSELPGLPAEVVVKLH